MFPVQKGKFGVKDEILPWEQASALSRALHLFCPEGRSSLMGPVSERAASVTFL